MNSETFAPRELCENLQAMGCKTESPFYYVWTEGGSVGALVYGIEKPEPQEVFEGKIMVSIPAFTQNDFTGATQQADDNCKIVWPGFHTYEAEIISKSLGYAPPSYLDWYQRKHGMLDFNREKENWHQYLERTMRK